MMVVSRNVNIFNILRNVSKGAYKISADKKCVSAAEITADETESVLLK